MAVRDATTHNQVEQEEVRSLLFKAVEIAVSVVDYACNEPISEVIKRPENVCGLKKQIAQMSLPARAVEVTEGKC